MTPESDRAFREWLEREIALAEYEAKLSSKFTRGGCRISFVAGRLYALSAVLKYFTG